MRGGPRQHTVRHRLDEAVKGDYVFHMLLSLMSEKKTLSQSFISNKEVAITKRFTFALLFLVFVVTLFAGCRTTTGRTAGELVDDTTIANTIRAKIVEDKELSVLKINTDVFNGNVTLLGVVSNREAEQHLISLARSVNGPSQ